MTSASFILPMAALLLVYTTVFDGVHASTPSTKYVEMTFSISWKEFCNIGNYFKKSISSELIYKNGAQVTPDKVVIFNFEDHCPSGKDASLNAAPKFYISQVSGSKDPENIDEEMTKKAYEVLKYYKDNGLEGYLGTLFKNKIESVGGRGVMDPNKADDFTETERLYIGLGVGLAVVVLVVIISVIVMYCCGNKGKDGDHGVTYKAPSASTTTDADQAVGKASYPAENQAFTTDTADEPTVHVHRAAERPDQYESTQL